MEHPWERKLEKDAEKAFAIVVLSSRISEPPGDLGIVEWVDPDRFNSGIKLYKEGKAEKLIFTGGYNPFTPKKELEGDFYRREAIKLGVLNENIITTKKIKNTLEEAAAVKNQIKKFENSSKSILLVTSAYHMQRAKQLFSNQGLLVKPFPVDFKSTNYGLGEYLYDPRLWLPNPFYLSQNSIALRELIGRLVYKIF